MLIERSTTSWMAMPSVTIRVRSLAFWGRATQMISRASAAPRSVGTTHRRRTAHVVPACCSGSIDENTIVLRIRPLDRRHHNRGSSNRSVSIHTDGW